MDIENKVQHILDRNFSRGDNANAKKELLDLFGVSKRFDHEICTYSKWFERVKYIGCFAVGFFIAVIVFSMFL